MIVVYVAYSISSALAPLLASIVPTKDVSHVFAAHTAVGKNVFPRLAGMLDSSLVGDPPAYYVLATELSWTRKVADIIALDPSRGTFTRPIYAGNAVLTVKSSPKDSVKIVTVRSTAFDKAAISDGSADVEDVEILAIECGLYL